MKILLMTDAEGVSGITQFEAEFEKDGKMLALQKFLLTNEINGAIDGALEAGAAEVAVLEYHDIDFLQLHPAAILHRSAGPLVIPRLYRLPDMRWDALAFVGNHAMAGPEGVLSHTQNQHVQCISINGQAVGEFAIQAAMAGECGMPTIFVSGDDVACRQARAIIPDIEIAVVKHATSRLSAWCLSPARAREAIRSGMAAAVRRWREIKPFVIPGPVVLREELKDNGLVRQFSAPTITAAFEERCLKNV